MIAEEIVARLRVDAGQFASGLAGAEGALNRFNGGARAAGKSMQAAGRSMTTGMTLPIVGLGAVVLKSAADFESAFTGVVKTVGGTEPEIAKLRTAILDMSETMPASAEEIAGVAEAAGQLGIPIGQIEGFTRTMVMMGEATNMTSQEAADSFAHFQNIMGVSSQDMAANSVHVGNAVVELGNKFAATESEIMNTAVRMAGAARVAGMSQPDVLALATAMADVGISSELGGTAMSQTFASMSSAIKGGGAELTAFAKVAGVSGQAFSTQFKQNAPQAVLAFVQGLQRIKKSGGDVFSTLNELGIRGQRQQQTLLSLAGASKKFAAAIKVSNDAFTKGNGLNAEYENRLKDFNAQLKMTGNEAKRVGIDLGLALLPAFKSALAAAQPLIGAIKNVANAFTSASPSTQTFIVSMLGVAAAMGPVTWMLGKVVSAAGIVAGGFRMMASGIGMLSGSSIAAVSALGSVAGVITIVVPAALAFNAAIMGITGKLGELTGLPSVFYSIGQSIVSLVPGVGPALAVMNQISGSVGGLSGFMNLLSGSTDQAAASAMGLGGALGAASNQIKQFSALSAAANGAALNSQLASMRQQLQMNAGAWGSVKGQILQTAAAQEQQRNMAIQSANGNQQAIQRANAGYQQSIVKLASVIPASRQAGGAFKALAASANMSAGQLKAAVNKYRQGGMSAGKALAAGLRQGAQQAGNAGKQAAARAANQTAQGMRAGGNKIKAASRQAGKGASTGLAQGVRQGAGQAKSAGNRVTQQLQQGFRQGGNKLKTAGQQAGKQGPQGIATGVQQGSGQAIAAETQMIAQLATTMVAAGGTLMSAGQSAGQMMGAGLVAGIQSMLGAAQAAAAELAAVAEEAMRSKAQIQSPSKVWTRLGRHMVAGLVKGLGYKKGVKDAASDLADATATAFNAKAMDFKQGAKKIVDYIVGVRQQIQQFAGVQAFDVSSARSQAAEYAAARDAAIEAAMREAAALKAKNQIQQRVDNAAKAVQQWDQAGNHYQVANALARQKTAMEQLTEATDAYTQAKDASNEADKAFGETKKGGVSAAGILADMTSRQQQATQFSESIKKLKNRGLNQKAIQQLIESGVESGGAIASALLAGANSRNNIAQVNRQTNLMEAASRSLGDYAGQAKFGAQGTYDRQNAIAETKIEVKDGAIRINWGGSAMTATDKAEFQKIAKESLDKALKQLARELRQKKKQK